MKTKIAMIAFMAMSFVVTAQNDYLTGQTKLVNPNPSGRTLLLEKNDGDSWLTFHDNGNAWYSMGIDQSNTNNFSLNYGGGLTSSQFVMTRDGKVGIGTSIPQSKFVVKDYNTGMSIGMGNNIVGLGFNRNVNGGQIYDENVSGWQFTARDERFSLEGYNGAKSNLFNVLKNGNVGIGTKTPTQSLDVNGHVKFDALSSSHTNLQIGHDVNDRIIVDNSLTKPYGGGYFFRVTPDPSLNVPHNYIDVMMLTDKGNVGIGTGDTKGFKLGVNGKIAATEVKVATYANWPDFVFKEDYTLPTLKEVENHIKTKGHLENIPSAKEVAKNGVLLGEMNKNLLQKIEELTLYTIQQEKEIIKQKEEEKQQNIRIENQQKQIDELKKLVQKLVK